MMTGLFVGGPVIAGAFTLLPGRLSARAVRVRRLRTAKLG